MCRTQCVLALLALCLGLAHSFSWDFVVAKEGRLDFYENYQIKFTEHNYPPAFIEWVAYDPVHNRVLTTTNYNWQNFVTGYDVETEITHFSMRLTPQFFVKDYPLNDLQSFAYDPITELIFASDDDSLYSFELKPGEENKVNGTVVIYLEMGEGKFREAAVDSCGKYVYWIAHSYKIERVRYDGSVDREVIIETNNVLRKRLIIERQKMYWIEYPVNNDHLYTIESADLNGNNRITLYTETSEKYVAPLSLTVSKDFIYWANNERDFWKLPKNLTRVTNETGIVGHVEGTFHYMTAYYDIEELNQTIQECEALKSNIESVNVSTDASLLCVHGTKVSGKNLCNCTQGYTGERCDVSVCQNYCVQGQCSVNAEGHPKCRCNSNYSGDRCESTACYNYCLNNGYCLLNESNQPVCQCSAEFEGERCEVRIIKHSEKPNSILDFLNNLPTDTSRLCVHGTKVNGKSVCECTQGYTGERCDVSVCQNYCFRGNCSVSDEGQPKCRCDAGYSGDRCESNACHNYCLNNGVCSLNETSQPVCQCSGEFKGERCDVQTIQDREVSKSNIDYCQNYCVQGQCSVSAEGQPKCRCNAGYSGDRCEDNVCYNYCLNNGVCSLNGTSKPVCQCSGGFTGDRCDVSDLLIKCIQIVSLLKDILKADLASITLGREVESTCASTVV